MTGLGPISGYTSNFKLKLVNFDFQAWSDQEHNNWRVIDALLYTVIAINNIQGVWVNSIAVTAGNRYVDQDDGTIWEVVVAHTTAASPTTFSADRAANPTYWVQITPLAPVYKGVWANDTSYTKNDFVSTTDHRYAIANTSHLSGSAPDTIDDDIANWDVIVDLSTSIAAADAAASDAATSETNAAASAAAAAGYAALVDNFNFQGGLWYRFDGLSTTMDDPPTGYATFNHATPASVTQIALSDNSYNDTNPDVSALLLTFDDSTSTNKGIIKFADLDNAGNFVIYQVTSLTDNSGWVLLTLTYVTGNGSFTHDSNLGLYYFRTGDKGEQGEQGEQGDPGLGSGDLIAANNLSDVANAATAFGNIKQNATASATGVVELATTAEFDAGSDASRVIVPSVYKASKWNLRHFDVILIDGETDVTTGAIAFTWVPPFAGTIIQDDSNPEYFMARNETAGITGTMVIDVHKNGTTIMTTNKLNIASGDEETTTNGTQPDLTTTTFSAGDEFTFEVDAIHTTPAKGLLVRLTVRPN